jgi:hypothetical protein
VSAFQRLNRVSQLSRSCQHRGEFHARCQYFRAFIAPLSTDNKNILGLQCSCAAANRFQICSEPRCQQPDVVEKRPLTDMCCVSLAICFQIANSRTRRRCNLKGLSPDGGLADFSKNLSASLFNDDLSSDRHHFGWIHLASQYRYL